MFTVFTVFFPFFPMSSYISLGDAIRAFLQKNGLDDEVRIRKALDSWEELMGAPVARNTEKVWVEKGVLYVKVSHPTWRQELNLQRQKIAERMNEAMGKPLVREVRVL